MTIENKIARWINRYEKNGYVNGSILVASKGDILLNKGFGMANFEHAVPNQSTTKFRIGSLTKAFTALAIFQLHENGKLDINDYIAKYLPTYPTGEKITIYHCLTCTSGIPNYTSFPDFWFKTMRLPMNLEQLIGSFQHHELEFEPGSQFEYSSSGYALLTAVIEKVSGMSYGDYIQEKICRPLGMEHTGCDDGRKLVKNLASGYSFWEEPIHAEYADLSFPLGGYGLYSTTGDLFIWDQAIQSSSLLNKELGKLMLTPYLDSYACGWMVSDVLGRKCIHHYGDISGFYSQFFRFVDERLTIIFLSNMSVTPVTDLSKEMAKVMLDEEVTLPLPMKEIVFTKQERIAGKYVLENARETILEVSLKNSELYLTVPKMYGVLYKFKLIPIRHDSYQTTFITEMVHEQLIFHYSPSGDIERVVYLDFNGKTRTAHKTH
ncbi:serine hydrolase domain-containing protein [Pseudoneobacillus sp. C159]